jgi:hypothetical protein
VQVVSSPESLAPTEEGSIELLFSPLETFTQPFEAPLTVELEDQQPIHFVLFALVLNGEWDVPRWIDLGGVEVGDTRVYGDTRITGIAGDFSEDPLRFSPRSLGPQRVEARHTGFLHCPFISEVTLLGDGVASVLTGPADVDFGDVPVGSSVERDVVVTNYSRDFLNTRVNAPFTILSGISPDVATRGANFELVPASTNVRVRFTPSTMGPVTQDLVVSAGAKALTISARGRGTP